MRIGNHTIARNYTTTLNRNLATLNKYTNQLTTMRRFDSMAEDASSGVRAMALRRSITNTESYAETAKTAQSQLAAAEGFMKNVSQLGQEIAAKYTTALNGTNTQDELKALKTDIEQLQKQILSNMNGQFGGRYVFGGTNTTNQPFTLDGNNDLFYNGVKVSDIDSTDPQYKYLFEDAAYVDIGMGFKGDADGNLINTTAFKNTMVGLDVFGSGDKNIFSVCGELLAAIDSPDFHDGAPYDELLNKMHSAYKDVTLSMTELGANTQFLTDTINRFDEELINMSDRQNGLEALDPAEAIIQMKMQEFVYNAALQMGQRLLQPTLFSFIS